MAMVPLILTGRPPDVQMLFFRGAGLCNNREDHEPHRHDSGSLGAFWCHADQTKRLPFAAEQRRQKGAAR